MCFGGFYGLYWKFFCGFRQNTRNRFKNDYAKRIFATKSRFFLMKKNLGGGSK